MNINDHKPLANYLPEETRYDNMLYRRCGNSGVLLPVISLGLWHNFGYADDYYNATEIIRTAFDSGITHIDLANNYGPPYGAAEETFGRILKQDFSSHRDELFIASKAGYDMWPGPYGTNGSRKYLIASCDASLKRLGLDYVDVFYHHRPDPETPLEETMVALDHLVKQGKALYVGISRYSPEDTAKAAKILKELGTPCLIHQHRYNMFDREPENGLYDTLGEEEIGAITFSPLAQGLLSNKYLGGIPEDSRANNNLSYFDTGVLNKEMLQKIQNLNEIAQQRGQTLSQMAIAWNLRHKEVTTVLIGVSKPEQIKENVAVVDNVKFSDEEVININLVLNS